MVRHDCLDEYEHTETTVMCSVCDNRRIGRYNVAGHRHGKRHRRKMRAAGLDEGDRSVFGPGVPVVTARARCLVCSLTPEGFPRDTYMALTEATYEVHVNGPDHLRRISDGRYEKAVVVKEAMAVVAGRTFPRWLR